MWQNCLSIGEAIAFRHTFERSIFIIDESKGVERGKKALACAGMITCYVYVERALSSCLATLKETNKMGSESTPFCIDILLAIILAPLGVFLMFGCKVEF